MRRTFARFWGPQTQNLGAETLNFSSGVSCPKLQIFTQGLLPFWGAQNSKSGAKTQKFYSGVFCPKLFLHLKSFLTDEGMQKVVQRYDKCLNSGGNCVEK
jgi:hypothetical protein